MIGFGANRWARDHMIITDSKLSEKDILFVEIVELAHQEP